MNFQQVQGLNNGNELNNYKVYYWLSSLQLADGSIVNPGTWYKIVSNTYNHNYALMEEVFERIRTQDYNEMPSRQRSMFVFADEDRAIKFKNFCSWNHTDVYEVVLCDQSSKLTQLDSDLAVPTITLDSREVRPMSTKELEIRATNYWNSKDVACERPEILVEGAIRIAGKK